MLPSRLCIPRGGPLKASTPSQAAPHTTTERCGAHTRFPSGTCGQWLVGLRRRLVYSGVGAALSAWLCADVVVLVVTQYKLGTSPVSIYKMQLSAMSRGVRKHVLCKKDDLVWSAPSSPPIPSTPTYPYWHHAGLPLQGSYYWHACVCTLELLTRLCPHPA